MAIDLPPPRIASADVFIQPKLAEAPPVLPQLKAQLKGFTTKDSVEKAPVRLAKAGDGLPGLEDKPPVAGAAA